MNDGESIAQAGLDAICAGWVTSMDPPYPVLADVERVVDAVRPLIQAELRERLASAIEASYRAWDDLAPHSAPHPMGSPSWLVQRVHADCARLVRERP